MRRMILLLLLQLPFGGGLPTVVSPDAPIRVLPFGGNPPAVPGADQDRWIVGIADIQVFVSGDVYRNKLAQNDAIAAANNNQLGVAFESVASALSFNRLDAESRVSAFVHDLCSHDPLYCNVSMAVNHVRFAAPPNPFVH